jgi:Ca2+-binding EF-hand superfamily protein
VNFTEFGKILDSNGLAKKETAELFVQGKLTAGQQQAANRMEAVAKIKTSNRQVFALLREKVEQLSRGGMKQARRAFQTFDPNRTGSVKKNQFQAVLKNWGMTLNDAQLDEIFAEFDQDGNGENVFVCVVV